MMGNRERTIDLEGPLTLLQAADVAQWYEQFAPHLMKMLCAQGPVSARMADDLVADVFVRVIEIAPRLAAMTSAARWTYVLRMAMNLHRDRVRRFFAFEPITKAAYLGSFEELEMVPVAETPDDWRVGWMNRQPPEAQPEQTTEARMTLKAVWEATPYEYRVLVLMLSRDLTQREMAAELGTTEKGVAMRLVRLRQYLLAAGRQIAG